MNRLLVPGKATSDPGCPLLALRGRYPRKNHKRKTAQLGGFSNILRKRRLPADCGASIARTETAPRPKSGVFSRSRRLSCKGPTVSIRGLFRGAGPKSEPIPKKPTERSEVGFVGYGSLLGGGQREIRTPVGLRHLVYSQAHLTALVSALR